MRDVPDGPHCQTRPNRPGFVLRHRGYVPVVERDNADARWEFRAWGVPDRTLLALQERARVTGTEAVRDHYLLGPAGGGRAGVERAGGTAPNVKVRSATLEVKRAIDRSGALERWKPAWSAEAPWQADAVLRLLDELDCRPPEKDPPPLLDPPLLDTEQLLDWLRGSIEGFAAVSADKFRTHYELAGVMAEHCEVSFDGGPVQESIAIESADLRRLASVRSQLGLHDEENLAMHEAAGMLGVRS